jgi:hypothetical protein
MARSYMLLERPLRAGAMIALLAVSACMAPRWVKAGDPGYEIQVGVIESDNIRRVSSAATAQTIAMEDLDFTWLDKRPWYDVDITGDLSNLSYLQGTYPDQLIGNFLGTSTFKLVPDLLSWNFSDNFGQTPLNALAPITPGNRENINYLNTGPVLTLPLGQELKLILTGEYGRVDYEQSPLDSNRLTAGVALGHDISRGTSISINAKDERVNYQNDVLNPDYSMQEAFARFDTKGSRTTLGVDLGYGRQVFLGINESSPIGRIDITRQISPRSTVGLSFGHDYSDGADSFLLVQTVGGATLNTQNAVQAAAPFVITYGTLAWNYRFDRTSVGLNASFFRDEYQIDDALNNDLTMANVSVTRQISPVLQLALTEYVDRAHFIAEDSSVTETDTGLQLTWLAGKRFSVNVAYYLAKGFSNVEANKYTENRLWLAVGYGRAAEAPPGPAPVRLPGAPQ